MRKLEFLDPYLTEPNVAGRFDWRECSGFNGGPVKRALWRVGVLMLVCMGLPFGAYAESIRTEVPYYLGTPDTDLMDRHPERQRQQEPETDLDRAMSICRAHEIASNAMYASIPPQMVPGTFPNEYAGCYKVRSAWDKSEAGRRAAAEARKIEEDKAFVKRFVESIKN